MALQFSLAKYGIVQRARKRARVDATQWPTENIANSCNDWLDAIIAYGVGHDKTFQVDDTNHTKLPEGTADLDINVSDYSFLSDAQGNSIITLTSISLLQNGKYVPLQLVDRNDFDYDPSTFGVTSGIPTAYDKIADNIIRFDYKPSSSITAGIKYTFQRTGSYFVDTDTTKSPGVSPLLHKGFWVNAAYDIADTLGLNNLQSIAAERAIEMRKIEDYFNIRNQDRPKPKMTMRRINFI